MATRTKSTEELQVEAAPEVETPQHVTVGKPLTPAQQKRADEKAARDALGKQVEELFSAQFGGEEREPTEGTEKWDPMVRELVIAADTLETQYRTILKSKEDNRTLLRALAGMGKVPTVVPDFYYPPKRKGSSDDDAS